MSSLVIFIVLVLFSLFSLPLVYFILRSNSKKKNFNLKKVVKKTQRELERKSIKCAHNDYKYILSEVVEGTMNGKTKFDLPFVVNENILQEDLDQLVFWLEQDGFEVEVKTAIKEDRENSKTTRDKNVYLFLDWRYLTL